MENNNEQKNIRLIIAYDGTGYFGWQRQKEKPTIQGAIEQKIETIAGKPVSLIAAGRTDAGVHALHQVANFRVASHLTPFVFFKALNALLPDSIIIKEAEQVPFEFHARYDVRSKVYEYRVYNDELPSPFLRNYAWHIPRPLDLPAMEECLSVIRGAHDFCAFCAKGDGITNTMRTMIGADLEIQSGGLLAFHLEANGFLRYMARNLVGTLVKVGLKKLGKSEFAELLNSGVRKHPVLKAPPGGLYLKDVRY